MRLAYVAVPALLPAIAFGAARDVLSTPGLRVPPGAAAAGFNTLALNDDFTKQLPHNWLGGCSHAGNGEPVGDFRADDKGHNWWLNFWWAYNHQRCIVAQKSDPKFGGLVLDMPWTVDTASAKMGTVIETASWDYNSSTHTGTANSFPIGSYYQITARIEPSATRGAYMTLHTWGPDGIADQNCGCVMEWDVMETSGHEMNKYDSAMHNWGGSGGGFILHPWETKDLAPGTPYNPAQYNTYGLRVTYDGAHRAVGCTCINDVFQRCLEVPISDRELHARNFLIIQNACDHWNQPNGCHNGLEQHLYIKRVQVFSCAASKDTQ